MAREMLHKLEEQCSQFSQDTLGPRLESTHEALVHAKENFEVFRAEHLDPVLEQCEEFGRTQLENLKEHIEVTVAPTMRSMGQRLYEVEWTQLPTSVREWIADHPGQMAFRETAGVVRILLEGLKADVLYSLGWTGGGPREASAAAALQSLLCNITQSRRLQNPALRTATRIGAGIARTLKGSEREPQEPSQALEPGTEGSSISDDWEMLEDDEMEEPVVMRGDGEEEDVMIVDEVITMGGWKKENVY